MSETIRSSIPNTLNYIAKLDWAGKTGGHARFGARAQGFTPEELGMYENRVPIDNLLNLM
jgi:hypothetical protein